MIDAPPVELASFGDLHAAKLDDENSEFPRTARAKRSRHGIPGKRRCGRLGQGRGSGCGTHWFTEGPLGARCRLPNHPGARRPRCAHGGPTPRRDALDGPRS